MSVALRRPLKIASADFLPTAIFSETSFRPDEVIIESHPTGEGFVEPHVRLGGILSAIPPAHDAGCVSSGDIGCKLALHHGIAHAALQTTSPDRRVIIRTTLIVGLEPHRNLAETIQIGSATYVAAKVCEVEALMVLFLGNGVVLLPQLQNTVIEHIPVRRRAGGRQFGANSTMTIWQAANRRPSVGVEAIYIVECVHLPHDGWNVIIHVGREHASSE